MDGAVRLCGSGEGLKTFGAAQGRHGELGDSMEGREGDEGSSRGEVCGRKGKTIPYRKQS